MVIDDLLAHKKSSEAMLEVHRQTLVQHEGKIMVLEKQVDSMSKHSVLEMPLNADIIILGATYGDVEVTSLFQSFMDRGMEEIRISDLSMKVDDKGKGPIFATVVYLYKGRVTTITASNGTTMKFPH
jgi:multimeric flavodoxin WrbA